MATPASLGVKAKRVADVPLDPDDPAWAEATPATVSMSAQAVTPPMGGGQVTQVEVRALHSGGEFAVRLTWKNPTTETLVGVKHFRDAAAVMFPVNAAPTPSPTMGQVGAPVLIWQWKADWEDFASAHAASMARYPDYMDYKHPTNDALNASFGDKPQGAEKVDVMVAEGFGSITRVGDAEVEARSSRAGEFTRVVFRRTLPATAPALVPGTVSALNVAVWDGSADNRGSRKSVSMVWTELLLEAPAAPGSSVPSLPVNGPMVGLGLLLLAAGALFAGGIARAEEVRKAELEREARAPEAKAR